MNELLGNASIKRAAVGAATAALIALNKRFGLGLELGDVAALVTLAVAYIGQSAMKQVAIAKVDAAAHVTDVKAAVDVLNAPAPDRKE